MHQRHLAGEAFDQHRQGVAEIAENEMIRIGNAGGMRRQLRGRISGFAHKEFAT